MEQENKNFIPLKVGDVCEYFELLLSGPISFDCVVKDVFEDGVTYYLCEILTEEEKTQRKCRDAIFTDNAEHLRTFVHDYGNGDVLNGYRGIRNIRRKKGED